MTLSKEPTIRYSKTTYLLHTQSAFERLSNNKERKACINERNYDDRTEPLVLVRSRAIDPYYVSPCWDGRLAVCFPSVLCSSSAGGNLLRKSKCRS